MEFCMCIVYRTFKAQALWLVANVLDCDIIVSEYEVKSNYYVHFWTNILEEGMNLLISPAMGEIVLQPFFYNDGFDIK